MTSIVSSICPKVTNPTNARPLQLQLLPLVQRAVTMTTQLPLTHSLWPLPKQGPVHVSVHPLHRLQVILLTPRLLPYVLPNQGRVLTSVLPLHHLVTLPMLRKLPSLLQSVWLLSLPHQSRLRNGQSLLPGQVVVTRRRRRHQRSFK